MHGALLLVAALALPALGDETVSRAELETLTQVLAAGAANEPGVEVTTEQDLRRVLALEAQREQAGCDDDSCLVEVAEALGARWVAVTDVGRLGARFVLTVSLFDAREARAAGRTQVGGVTLEEVSARGSLALRALLGSELPDTAADADEPERLLVLDARAAGTASTPPPAPEPAVAPPRGVTAWGIAGGGLAVVGGVGLLAAGGLWALAWSADRAAATAPDQPTAVARYEERDGWTVAGSAVGAVSAVVLAAGVGLFALELVGP